jgi:hypothetical protein
LKNLVTGTLKERKGNLSLGGLGMSGSKDNVSLLLSVVSKRDESMFSDEMINGEDDEDLINSPPS